MSGEIGEGLRPERLYPHGARLPVRWLRRSSLKRLGNLGGRLVALEYPAIQLTDS
jgi:hypothetical protein